MKNYTLIQRNTDFMKAVRAEWKKISEEGGDADVEGIISSVINSPAPEFYVTYETAYRYVSLARRGKLPHTMEHVRRRMWEDLSARVLEIMAEHRDWNYARALVEAVDRGNAPSWYLSHRYAYRLYYSLLREGIVQRRTLLRNRDMTGATH